MTTSISSNGRKLSVSPFATQHEEFTGEILGVDEDWCKEPEAYEDMGDGDDETIKN